MRNRFMSLVAGSLLASTSVAAPTWKYAITDVKVTDLHESAGKESVANDINDHGEIVGWSDTPEGWHHGVLWRNDQMEVITPYEGYLGEARGINNLTQIVGFLRPLSQTIPHAFHWDARSGLNLLNTAYTTEGEAGNPNCATAGDAKAINDSGVITGLRFGGCHPPEPHIARAARWMGWWAPWEQIIPLGSGGKQNFAYNINSAGVIVGWDKDGNTSTGAFHWSQGTGSDAVPFPVVPPPQWVEPSRMKAYGINDSSRIVGSAKVNLTHDVPPESLTLAFYWDGVGSQATWLPPLNKGESVAFEVNNDAFSVGYSDNRDRWAVIWHGHLGVRSLPMPPGAGNGLGLTGKHCEALAVNNRNPAGLIQAVGYCEVGGARHAVRWDITTQKIAVP